MKTTKQLADIINKIAEVKGVDLSVTGAHFKIENEPYMPLCVEVIGEKLISVAHYYEQNGDLIADPDMVFHADYLTGLYGWMPVSIQQSYGGYKQCTWIDSCGMVEKFKPNLQAELASFANMWARNIKAQGFLNAAKAAEAAQAAEVAK